MICYQRLKFMLSLKFFKDPAFLLYYRSSTIRICAGPHCHFTPVTLRRRTSGTAGDPDDRYVASLSRPRVSLLSPESPLMVTSANLGELCPIYNNFLNRRRAQIYLHDCSIEYFHVVSKVSRGVCN